MSCLLDPVLPIGGSLEGTDELLLTHSLRCRPKMGSDVDTDPDGSKSKCQGQELAQGYGLLEKCRARGKCFPRKVGWLASPPREGRAARGGGGELGQLKMGEKKVEVPHPSPLFLGKPHPAGL